MFNYWSEPSLADVLSDPVIQAVMAADDVDPAALSALLRKAARKIELDSRPSRAADTPSSRRIQLRHAPKITTGCAIECTA
jgi:hypothetical protein